MKSHLECIPCFVNQSIEAAKMTTDDEVILTKVIKEVIKYFENADFEKSPPDLSRDIHQIIRKNTGSKDPYKNVKNQSNKMAEKMYPYLKKLVNESDDSLLMSIKLAIVGNVIDFGTSNRFNVEDMINEAVKKKFVDDAYPRFKTVLEKADTILYLADNTGEIFFDKLLLEELNALNKNITYVVKANPIINDAMMEDAKYAGIDKMASIIEGDKGQDKSTPGISLKYASEEFMNYYNKSDMVISKGQGNYESLNDCDREIFFLLMIKCPIVAADIGVDLASFMFKVKK